MRSIVPLALILLLAPHSAPLAAQSRPDFSGSWALDVNRSQASVLPESATLSVVQNATTMRVENATTISQVGEQRSTMTFNFDGSPSINTTSRAAGSIELTSTARWDGPVLVVSTKGDAGGQVLQFSERWTLDSDGKTLRRQREITMAGQTRVERLIFAKQ
jgi:hypothetical protein